MTLQEKQVHQVVYFQCQVHSSMAATPDLAAAPHTECISSMRRVGHRTGHKLQQPGKASLTYCGPFPVHDLGLTRGNIVHSPHHLT